MRRPTRLVSSAALAVGSVGALAGCGTAADGASADAAGGSGATGTWSASGDYTTPGGTETVDVTLSVRNGTVTAVSVSGSGHTPNSRQYQQAFASGIDAQVVGKPLATLDVGAVSGSSLTSQGFDAAVETIRAEAA